MDSSHWPIAYEAIALPLCYITIGTLWQFRTADPLGVNETLYHWANKAKIIGAPSETRTRKIWLLRPTRIPIPSSGRKNIFESTVVCLVGSFKVLPPDPQAFQSMMGSHKFSPNNGRCLDWRLSSLTVGMPFLLLTLSKMLSLRRGNYSTSSS